MNSVEPYIKCAISCGYEFHKTVNLDSEFMAQDWRKECYDDDDKWVEMRIAIYYYEETLDFRRVFLDFLPTSEKEKFEKEIRNHLIDYINEQ